MRICRSKCEKSEENGSQGLTVEGDISSVG